MLEEVEFVETDLNNSVFDECNLLNSTFDNTNLQNVDFRTAFNFSIDLELNHCLSEVFSPRCSLEISGENTWNRQGQNGLSGLLDKYKLDIEFDNLGIN